MFLSVSRNKDLSGKNVELMVLFGHSGCDFGAEKVEGGIIAFEFPQKISNLRPVLPAESRVGALVRERGLCHFSKDEEEESTEAIGLFDRSFFLMGGHVFLVLLEDGRPKFCQ
jgi:hypothetical protein